MLSDSRWRDVIASTLYRRVTINVRAAKPAKWHFQARVWRQSWSGTTKWQAWSPAPICPVQKSHCVYADEIGPAIIRLGAHLALYMCATTGATNICSPESQPIVWVTLWRWIGWANLTIYLAWSQQGGHAQPDSHLSSRVPKLLGRVNT